MDVEHVGSLLVEDNEEYLYLGGYNRYVHSFMLGGLIACCRSGEDGDSYWLSSMRFAS